MSSTGLDAEFERLLEEGMTIDQALKAVKYGAAPDNLMPELYEDMYEDFPKEAESPPIPSSPVRGLAFPGGPPVVHLDPRMVEYLSEQRTLLDSIKRHPLASRPVSAVARPPASRPVVAVSRPSAPRPVVAFERPTLSSVHPVLIRPDLEEVCPICQDTMAISEANIFFGCTHGMHTRCFGQLKCHSKHPQCPVCRASTTRLNVSGAKRSRQMV